MNQKPVFRSCLKLMAGIWLGIPLVARAAHDPPAYHVVDFLAEGCCSPSDISNDGTVVDTGGDEIIKAQAVAGEWVLTVMPFDDPFCWFAAHTEISDAGAIVGTYWCHPAPWNPSMFWEQDNPAQSMFVNGTIVDINNSNQVLGHIPGYFLWEAGELTNLSFDQLVISAVALNDQLEIAGQTLTDQSDFVAALWVPSGSPGLYTTIELGTLGGDDSSATAINGSTQVTGWSQLEDGTVHPFLWENGVMTDLGALDGMAINEAHDINGSGLIVGQSRTADLEVARAFVWTGDLIYDLNNLVVSGANLELNDALVINDRGQILGQGSTPEGDTHTYLAVPIDPDLNGDGSINGSDLALLLGAWGPCDHCPTDLNADNTVDADDLTLLLEMWG